MKNNIFRRGLSLFLAMVTVFTMFSGLELKASAAGEQTAVYIVEFPRSGDANSGANWGNNTMSFMNGWSMPALRTMHMRAIGSYTGPVCYCIEPGNGQRSGDTFTSKDESYWDNFPGNGSLSGDEIKIYIGRILQYGYSGNMSVSWYSQNENDRIAMSHALATQILIWETIVGERDSSFNKVGTGGKNAIWDMISPSNPIYTTTLALYDNMVRQVQNHTKVPSFFARSTGKAQEIELEWNGSEYVATLTDSNNVLDNYSFSANVTGFEFSTEGNKLTIKTKTPPTDTVTISATKKNGSRTGFVTWADGSTGVQGSKQDIVTYAQSVSDPVKGYLKVKVSLGSAKIVKTSEDGVVEGISFTVEGENFLQNAVTGADGTLQIDNLIPGVYTITEQNYERYEPQDIQRVTVVSGQVATANFSNTLRKGSITVTKTSEDGFVEGMKFRLHGTSIGGISVDMYAVTDSNGKALFENVPIGSGYTLEEVDTAVRYVVPDPQNVTVNWNEVTERTVHNALKKFNVTVTKSDIQTGTAQGNASLAGAVYGIYKGEALVDEYTTDANGQFTTQYYICGDDWTVREIAPSEGYLLDSAVYHVGASSQLYTIEHNTLALDVVEEAVMGSIAITKHADDGETHVETPEPDAQFEIYLKSAGSFANAKDSEKDLITTDEFGFAQSKDLPYGIYTVHQIAGKEGYHFMKDFDVYIAEDGNVYRYIINNAVFKSFIKVVKKDAETGNIIPLAGSAFNIYDPEGNKVQMSVTYPETAVIDTFYTNEEGWLITPQSLKYGKGYSVQEVQAPYGYVLNSERVYFDVTADSSSQQEDITVVEVVKNNAPQKGTITIHKSGEVFSSVAQGEDVYQPVYQVQGLPGAIYEIRAAEDIYTPDGTLRVSAFEYVDTLTTDEAGYATSKQLYLGKYQVAEVFAPHGMVINDEVIEVELAYAGQDVGVTTSSASYVNDRQKVEISLFKSLETDETYNKGMNGEMADVTFGIFASADITAADGSIIPADGLIEIVAVSEGGSAQFTTDLPFGQYYVKEISTNPAYMLNENRYPVDFTYVGFETAKVSIIANDAQPIENNLIRGSVSGLKIDTNGTPLEGAVFSIFPAGTEDFTIEGALANSISNEIGEFAFENIPYGEYVIYETQSPEGFVPSGIPYSVIIDEDGQIVEITAENRLIHGNVQLTKFDADYPENTLSGAQFDIFKDMNGDGQLDMGDEFIGHMEELSDGIYRYDNLSYGGYFVKESIAPQGFILDDNAYFFEIIEDGTVVEVENEAGKGFINTAQKGSLRIEKRSEDGKLEGFTFKVEGTDTAGNMFRAEYTTNAEGIIEINGLRTGTYIVSEIENDSNKQYVLPDSQTVEINHGETDTLSFYNKLKPKTPVIYNTGDTTNPLMWLNIAVASFGGLVAMVAVKYVKRRRQNKDKFAQETDLLFDKWWTAYDDTDNE